MSNTNTNNNCKTKKYLCSHGTYSFLVNANDMGDAKLKTAKRINENMGYGYVNSRSVTAILLDDLKVID